MVAVGTMTTFYALGNAILVLPLTALAIRFARRTALNVVMIVFVASNLAVALAPESQCVTFPSARLKGFQDLDLARRRFHSRMPASPPVGRASGLLAG